MNDIVTKETILRLDAVKKRTGLSRSSIYAFVKAGTFPAPVKLGARSIGWAESLIDKWVQMRVSKRCGHE